VSRYRFVSTVKAEGFPVEAACEVAEVSTSAYYEWLARSAAPTEAEWDEALVINEMRRVHDELDDTYGSPRMTDELRDRGFCDNHKRVERLMSEYGLHAQDGRRRKVRTTIPDVSAPPPPDLVKRDFSVGEPGERTCGDITYIPTGEGWLYLADVLDLGSRRVVGYAMEGHMRSEFVEACSGDGRGDPGWRRGGHGVPPRPRVVVHGAGLQGAVRQAQDRPVGRPHRVVPGQRRSGVVLGDTQARAGAPLPVRHARRGPSGDHRLDQPLQRAAASLLHRPHLADRVGATLGTPSTQSRINMCPADGGKAKPPCWDYPLG